MIENSSNNLKARKILDLLKAERQLVPGIMGVMYTVTMELGYTMCKKGEDCDDCTECPLDTTEVPQICKVKIWEQAWKDVKEVHSASCSHLGNDLDANEGYDGKKANALDQQSGIGQ